MCMELNCKYVECVGDGDGAEDDGQCLDLDIHYICSKKKDFKKNLFVGGCRSHMSMSMFCIATCNPMFLLFLVVLVRQQLGPGPGLPHVDHLIAAQY